MNFMHALTSAWNDRNSLLCVGLDPDAGRLPAHLKGKPGAILQFCTAIVDATADLVCCFKPQIAYFSACRAEEELEALIAHIHSRHPAIPVILDAKRGDIGSTAEQYAIEAFERYQADAVTINPYLGRDSVAPYLAYRDKGVILLCRTSNPGGSDLQFLDVGGEKLYERLARLVSKEWNENGQCGLVVGATFPQEIARVRALTGNMPLLVPGVGAQGGDVAATVAAGCTSSGNGLMINSSRAILYAGSGEDYAEASRVVARETRDAINRYRPSAATAARS
ncbi:MAG TPA: orotidine-5'-phosphate decarboxylase [Candidatus Accumulibacter phosphatis]|nr:orotidine-5'-phosphate decarboxylase [Accumulibacter sp.]HRL76167.1 orotidine-5'-phosphate decarboxylase [Candidatus Accumulibacter phosphatis]HCN68225.1 orotidine-5'-phosphate decarboxylase [Accumulibacter sp.]HCV12972.1 orotidine-5'-phosphate decarboxylase [Accumulibacter sp.]HRQ94334.1 orotidine-5'-phosphate decarboxylase [Candidatus Accumulibacter phosphatis]